MTLSTCTRHRLRDPPCAVVHSASYRIAASCRHPHLMVAAEVSALPQTAKLPPWSFLLRLPPESNRALLRSEPVSWIPTAPIKTVMRTTMTSQAIRSRCAEFRSSSGSTSLVSRSRILFTSLTSETMTNELQGRLIHLADSPNATLPTLFDLDASNSPRRSAPLHEPHVRHLRTIPSDPCLTFSSPKSRVSSGNEARELRLAAVRAEEDAAIIAQLEGALAEARDGEEAQRKAAARLRRDLSRMQRDLEHAEDVITDHQRVERTISEAGRDRLRSVERVTEWTRGTASLSRSCESYGPPPDEEVSGWGATCFPEFPREDESQVSSEAATEVAGHTNSREVSPTNESQATPLVPLSDSASSDPQSEAACMSPASAVIMPDRPQRPRPLITATTFASPARDSVGSPLTQPVTINAPTSSRPPTAQPTPVGAASRHTRTFRTSGTGSNLLKESMRVRTQSFTSGPDRLSPPTRTHTLSTDNEGLHARSPSNSTTSACSEHSRIDSVRSIYSAVVGVHRSLGSELGSRFHPTPTKESAQLDVTPTFVPFTPVNVLRPQQVRQVSSPTATFHFRGTLESPSRANAYDYEHPEMPRRMGPVAEDWSPQSWPTPCPPPRDAPAPPRVPELYFPEEEEKSVQLRTPGPMHAQQGWPSMPGAGPGATPSPHATTGLAPCSDPWDEYSDRPTPSPRMRNLRPLLLCTKPAQHARSSSLALAKDRPATAAAFRFRGMLRGPPQPIPEPTPSTAVVAYARHAGHAFAPSYVSPPPVIILPITIPGRITHDLFCLVLVFIDYLEWFIILLYRFTIDLRAGPNGADPALGFKRRNHPARFYI